MPNVCRERCDYCTCLICLTLRITCAEGLELRRAVDSGRYAIPRMTALFTDTPSDGLRPLLARSRQAYWMGNYGSYERRVDLQFIVVYLTTGVGRKIY